MRNLFKLGGASFCLLLFVALLVTQAAPAWAHTQEEKTFYLQSRIVLQVHPGDVTARNAIGVWHLEYNELDQSREAFETTLEFSPGHYLAVAGLALILGIEQKHREALELLDKARDPPEKFLPFLLLIRGRLHFRQGNTREAEKAFTRAHGLTRDSHDVLLWMGIMAEEKGERKRAMAFYRQAIKVDPYWQETYSRLSLLYAAQGDRKKAAQTLQEMLRVENPSPYPNNDIMVLWNWVMSYSGQSREKKQ